MKDDFDVFADQVDGGNAGYGGRDGIGNDGYGPSRPPHRVRRFIVRTLIVLVVVAAIVGALMMLTGKFKKPDAAVNAGGDSTKSSAPYSDVTKMKQGIDDVASCGQQDWQDVDASQLPGVQDASVCQAKRVAFITFRTDAAASMDGALVRAKAGDLLAQYAEKVSPDDIRILDGGRWMAIGEKDTMTTLQHQWGGKLETVENPQ